MYLNLKQKGQKSPKKWLGAEKEKRLSPLKKKS